MRIGASRVETARNFATKLWNAARFCEMNGCARDAAFAPEQCDRHRQPLDLGEARTAAAAVTADLEAYRFNEAAGAVYHFVWSVFCDWYLEFIKPTLLGSDEALKAETRACAAFTLDQILKMLHPFMPFITEELWARTGEKGPARKSLLIVAEWPKLDPLVAPDAKAEMQLGGRSRLRRALGVRGDERAARRKDAASCEGRERRELARGSRGTATSSRPSRACPASKPRTPCPRVRRSS